jgi:hypothetical protein
MSGVAEKYNGFDWPNALHEMQADIFADLNKELPIESDVTEYFVTARKL